MNATALKLVRWQDLDPGGQEVVRTLSIPQEQVEFAGTVDRAILACESAPLDEVAGLAIVRKDSPVGFVVLSRSSKKPEWAPPDAVALTAMRIDASMQGQGIGKAALAAVDLWVLHNWPTIDTITLCVDDQNSAGRRAYEHAGYRQCTEPKQGRIGLVRYLSKSLAGSQRAA